MNETLQAVLQGLVVIGFIVLAVRAGGVGLGIWGAVGVAFFVFVLQEAPGSPPTSAFFIVLAVITAASVMQAAGGIEWLVAVATKIIRANPKRITFVAPIVTFFFTVGAGTGNIYFSLLPVIYQVSYANGIRPERPLAVSATASQMAIVASPVSAAMAVYIGLVPGASVGKVVAVILPAALVSVLVAAFVANKRGKELEEDPEFQRRLAAGEIGDPAAIDIPDPSDVESSKRLSALIFLFGVVAIVFMGLFEGLRPSFPTGTEGESEPLDMTITIQLVMFIIAAVILTVNKVKPKDVLSQSIFPAGITSAIALFGLAWLANTYIAANESVIVNGVGDLVQDYSWIFGITLFIVAALTTSQSSTTASIVPIGVAAGLSSATITALWPSVIGIYLFPANGSQVATVTTDETGTTKISKLVIWHSFTIPMLVMWIVSVAIGLVIAPLIF
jgi:anaerobic C4-dicarboxylate transporter DcuA/anaerobic C4-dicarboxylate transporter DcuB